MFLVNAMKVQGKSLPYFIPCTGQSQTEDCPLQLTRLKSVPSLKPVLGQAALATWGQTIWKARRDKKVLLVSDMLLPELD